MGLGAAESREARLKQPYSPAFLSVWGERLVPQHRFLVLLTQSTDMPNRTPSRILCRLGSAGSGPPESRWV